MLLVSMETDNEILNDFYNVPIIGSFIVFLVAMCPVPIMFLTNSMFDLVEVELTERIAALLAGCWNVLLTFKFNIKISFILIPCWILFTIIGVLKIFQIIV